MTTINSSTPGSKGDWIIQATDLVKSYGGKRVVDSISLQVKRGSVFGILGPNGAGKTTTMEMLEAFRPIDSGQAVVDGLDVRLKPEQVRRSVGIQLQSTTFFDKLTLVEQLRMFSSIYGCQTDTTALLEDVGLTDKSQSFVEHLSGGQRQRFAIAAALVNSPSILFLDEPTTGLDPQSRRNLWGLIDRIKKTGVTVVLTTHYMDEAEYLCDEIVIMDHGKVIAQDKPANLIRALVDRGFKKEQLSAKANLEDVFIDLTGKALRD